MENHFIFNHCKIAILGSTKGSDAFHILQSIHDGILTGISVECVISNREKAPILEHASYFNIPKVFLNPKLFNNNDEYNNKLSEILDEYKVNYILLIGWMKILTSDFVSKWKNRVINIHPSLLPAFEGNMDMNIHRAVLERGCKVTGATLMFVDKGVDTGPIIAQAPVIINEIDTPETLKTRVQEAEKHLFTEYLPLLRDGKVELSGNKVVVKK